MNYLFIGSLRRTFFAAALIGLTVLGGCATKAIPIPLIAENSVTHRVQERWAHLLKSEYANAYNYLTPAERAVTSKENYVRQFGTNAAWLSARVESVSCESNERCSAAIALQTQVVARGFNSPITTRVTEIWVFADGYWWFYKNP